jgi:hypothetical protein
VADPEGLTRSRGPCTTTGTMSSPAHVRAAHIRLVRSARTGFAALSRAAGLATNAHSDDGRQANQSLRDVSACLLHAMSRAPGDDPEDMLQVAELAFVEVGAYLSGLVGTDGYRTLVARAVHLAASEFPFLAAVKPASSEPGRLVGLPKPDANCITASEARNAAITLLAELLGLLREFIGRDLTQHVVVLVWPSLAPTSTSRCAEPRACIG